MSELPPDAQLGEWWPTNLLQDIVLPAKPVGDATLLMRLKTVVGRHRQSLGEKERPQRSCRTLALCVQGQIAAEREIAATAAD